MHLPIASAARPGASSSGPRPEKTCMSLLTKTLNGAVFFTGFIPSFTRIGYRARRAR